MKTCFKCGEYKPLDDFYKHKKMVDGHLGKCKECTKRDSRERQRLHGKEIYERGKVIETPEQRTRRMLRGKVHREKYPLRYKARTCVNNALRRGAITKQPCKCGNPKVQAHHEDYSKPLEIDWMCRRCHLTVHGKKPYTF